MSEYDLTPEELAIEAEIMARPIFPRTESMPKPAPTPSVTLTGFFAETPSTVSEPMERVNAYFDGDDIVTMYDRLVGKEREDARGRTESIKCSCPNPTHRDAHPSAWFNTDKGVITCRPCGQGWNKAGLVAMYYGIENTPANYPLIKREYAKRVHGYDYTAALAVAVPPSTPAGPSMVTSVAPRWQRADLREIATQLRAGTIVRPKPTVGKIELGDALFYPGKVNGVAGDSNAGKSFTALLACLQEVQLGNYVLLIDYEEGALGTVSRLVDMGATDDELSRFIYVNPDDAFDPAWVTEVLDDTKPTLVIIDSTGVSMALDGSKPNDDDDVARWFVRVPIFIANHGPAVVILDHVTKDSSGGGMWPIGSQRKRAAITGAQYMQQIVEPFSRAKDGFSLLTCAKDRHGTYSQGDVVARLEVKDAAAVVRLVMERKSAGSSLSGNAQAVLKHIKDNPGCIQGEIERGTGLRNRPVADAIKELKSALLVTVSKDGTANRHTATAVSSHPDVPDI